MKCNYKPPKNGRYGMVFFYEKHCKKCIYKNCPDKKSNSHCNRFRPKKGK